MLFVLVVIYLFVGDVNTTHQLGRNLKQFTDSANNPQIMESFRLTSTDCNPQEEVCESKATPSSTLTPMVTVSSAVLAEVLLDFKNSMMNSKGLLTSWQGTDPCAGWVHVICSGENVIKLSLPNIDVASSIPTGLSLFQNLQILQLPNVKLTGTIPPQLSTLQNLRIIELDSNRLTGTIPEQFSTWVNVEFVDFQFNQLYGTLPPQFSVWRSLKDLYLTSNQMTGTVPQVYAGWNFNSIFLSSNQFEGRLPARWESSDKVHSSRNNFI
eukprot:TRINITY_DN153_c1_g1_i2.p2 TRINITY_DN153_c1_g1~~TRINITY_DN153_c1_g1_i2.p2  ORF type:complete len:268 (+),score=26.93 TRINITY_DN153_c1_g1_i2:136-939(+)